MPTLYSRLSGIRYLNKHYSRKFLFVAFLGIHTPLIIISLLSITDTFNFNKKYVLLAILTATLLASALTLYFLNKLLWPLREAKNALTKYVSDKEIPQLPVQFEDEAGVLLRELQYTIEHLDYLIEEKKDIVNLLSNDIRQPFEQFMSLSTLIYQDTDKENIRQNALKIKDISVKYLLTLNDVLKYLKANDAQKRTGITYGSHLKSEK